MAVSVGVPGRQVSQRRKTSLNISPEIALALLLAATAVALPPFAIFPLYSVILFLCLVGSPRLPPGSSFWMPIRPLLLLFPIGAIFCGNQDTYAALKDAWYLSKIFLCFGAGFLVAFQMREPDTFWVLYVKVSALLALIFVVRFISSGDLNSIATGNVEVLDRAREAGGNQLLVCVFALPLLLRRKRIVVTRNKMLWFGMCIILVLQLACSMSRTIIICSLIAFASVLGFTRRRWFIVSIFSLGAGIFLLGNIASQLSNANDTTFGGKLLNSLSEVRFAESADPTNMVRHWRGFEAYMAQMQFERAPLLEQLFGQGFGATVDIGQYVGMGRDMTFRYLPIIHNGYWYIITKYGAFGLVLYMWFLFEIFRGSGLPRRGGFLADLRVGTGLIIVVTTLVITGIFNLQTVDGTCTTLGALYGQSLRNSKWTISLARRRKL